MPNHLMRLLLYTLNLVIFYHVLVNKQHGNTKINAKVIQGRFPISHSYEICSVAF